MAKSMLLRKMRKQPAVYWAPTGTDEYGDYVYATGIPIMVRWVDNQREFIDGEGQKRMSMSQVFVEDVLLLGGVLWLGEAADADLANPYNNAGAHQIARSQAVPDIRAKEYLREVMLTSRSRGSGGGTR